MKQLLIIDNIQMQTTVIYPRQYSKIPLLRGGCRQADGVDGFNDLLTFAKIKTSTPSASADTPQEGNKSNIICEIF